MELGVCYYPEQWPRERWAIDAKMMKEAGLSLVRIAEFAWTFMEPEEGEFAWGWLDEAIETISGAGLRIILCTPTATPPAWLCKNHSDILPVDVQGRRRRFGSRRHYCLTSATYRRHTERIVTEMATRYGSHPSIIGWQVDNEFGCHDTARCYCEECAAQFRVWLQAKYQSLDAVNAAWGTAFWNQRYTGWEQIEPPNLTITEPNPSQTLDYYRFASDTNVCYQQIQVDLLRRLSPDRIVTTNFMGNFPDLDYHDMARPLDLVTWDSYPTGYTEMQQGEMLYAPSDTRPVLAYDVGDPYITGFCHDIMRGLKQAPFWVMEQQSGYINWSRTNSGVNAGAVRLWTWHALTSGADKVIYFHWRSTVMAQEQHHSGLLRHDTSPDVGFDDLISMQAERDQMAAWVDQPTPAQVALLLDYDHLWAIQLQPHRADFGVMRHLFVYYAALQRLGITVDIVAPAADLSRYKLIISPTHFLANPDHVDQLSRYVTQGGTLLLGIRSGFKTPTNLVTDQPLPGLFRDLIGATVGRWLSLPDGVSMEIEAQIANLSGAAATWVEALEPSTAQTLASYTSGALSGAAALTINPVGTGQAAYIGFYPSAAQAQALVAHLAEQLGIPALGLLPDGVIAVRRGHLLAILNFTAAPATVTVNGQAITIAPRDLQQLNA